jgi:cytochrome c peroxidase
MRVNFNLFLSGALLAGQTAFAHGPAPVSLQNVPIPPVPGLTDGPQPIVANKSVAIALGKALFWDTQAGSDGQACASCHFSAGVDARITNQINPGQNSSNASGQIFSAMPSGSGTGGSNYTLTQNDFPLFQVDASGKVIYSTDDIVGSAGTFGGQFTGTSQFTGVDDQCNRSPDPVFNVNGVGVRRVEPRNTPTVINAVFNHRNFWDGRANNTFNGSSPWGNRDPNAGVWVKSGTTVSKQLLNLINSSLASQALAPPVVSTQEMGCQSRNWPDIGRKLLSRQPLQYQQVHNQDSVLGSYSRSSASQLQNGLNTTYRTLVTKAFNPIYWSYAGIGQFGAPAAGAPYNQMEANFSMFFGLAVQLYESTLVSDQSPFDLSPLAVSGGLLAPTFTNISDLATQQQAVQGYLAFVENHCGLCHNGPTLSSAAITTSTTLLTPSASGATFGTAASPIAYGPNAFGSGDFAALMVGLSQYGNVVNRYDNFNGFPVLSDIGFMNTGVTNPSNDPGVAGVDPFGKPLSYTAQYINYLTGNTAGIYDPTNINNQGVQNTFACLFFDPLATIATEAVPQFYFLPIDGIIVDGSKEGQDRTSMCATPQNAYIPTQAAANADINTQRMATATQAAFKVPTLRNVELTGPYMHNGSMSTLQQVIDFYSRQGNVQSANTSFFMSLMQPHTAQTTQELVTFLTTLTDNRVKYQQAPFDHPQITIPNGQTGTNSQVSTGNPLGANLAQDQYLTIPAVGASGSATPIPSFSTLLPP